jgi:hypothetical protein
VAEWATRQRRSETADVQLARTALSSDAVMRDVPVAVLAAGAYELTSLPAMATSLLRQSGFGEGVAEILAAFLSADFERLFRRPPRGRATFDKG